MSNLTLTIQLTDEDRSRLDKLISMLSGSTGAAASVAPVAGSVRTPEAPVSAPVVVSVPDALAPEITQAQVQSRVMELCSRDAEIKAKVKKALNKYSDSVPHLKKENYAAFLKDLEVLG